MIVVLNDRKRKSLSVRKPHKQSGFDWILANSRYITTNISTDRFLELAPGRNDNSTATHNALDQGCQTQFLEGRSPAEFRCNPN